MTDPTTGSPKNPARAWAVGCGLLVALAILATIAPVAVTAWWLYRDDTPRPDPVLATGEERLWVEARFDPRKAWVGKFAGRIVTWIGAIAPPEVPPQV